MSFCTDNRRRLGLAPVAFAVVFAIARAAAAPPGPVDSQTAARIDRIFAPLATEHTPGCALAVTRGGTRVLERGYGMANLELGVPITPRTVFDIGSVSKQFTAMSVLLLARDGRLSLDEDIRRTVPELPDYGTPITLRMMLHHLSGLRSYTDLFDLAGVPEADLTGDGDALALVARQRALNFAPGAQYLYSDTNYFLLALVVKRVSGRSLRDFARERIFGPLGMTRTQFNDSHRRIVPGRATGYAPAADGGFEIDMSNFEQLGDGAVLTNVEDLARWEANFAAPRVGGPAAVALLQEPGVRNDGSRTPYAMGLIRDRYRGVERVQHTGEWVGYRSSFLRFPQRSLGIVVLCNEVGETDPLALSERVADVLLDAAHEGDAGPAADAAAFAGEYWNGGQLAYLSFRFVDGALALEEDGAARKLGAIGAGRFEAGNSATRFEFQRRGSEDGVVAISDDFDPVWLARMPARAPAPTPLGDFAGSYESADLGVSWRIEAGADGLVRRQPLYPAQTLTPLLPDVFSGALSEGRYVLRFTRDAAGQVDGFDVATSMVRPLRFARTGAAAPGEARPAR